jgi:hypothetical protein
MNRFTGLKFPLFAGDHINIEDLLEGPATFGDDVA